MPEFAPSLPFKLVAIAALAASLAALWAHAQRAAPSSRRRVGAVSQVLMLGVIIALRLPADFIGWCQLATVFLIGLGFGFYFLSGRTTSPETGSR